MTEDHPEGVSVSPEPPYESSINTKPSPSTASVLFGAIENLWSVYPTHRRGGAISFLKKLVHQEKLNELDLSNATDFISQHKNKDWKANSQARFIPGIKKFLEERTWLVPDNSKQTTPFGQKNNESNLPKIKYFKPNAPVKLAPIVGLEYLSAIKKQLSLA